MGTKTEGDAAPGRGRATPRPTPPPARTFPRERGHGSYKESGEREGGPGSPWPKRRWRAGLWAGRGPGGGGPAGRAEGGRPRTAAGLLQRVCLGPNSTVCSGDAPHRTQLYMHAEPQGLRGSGPGAGGSSGAGRSPSRTRRARTPACSHPLGTVHRTPGCGAASSQELLPSGGEGRPHVSPRPCRPHGKDLGSPRGPPQARSERISMKTDYS